MSTLNQKITFFHYDRDDEGRTKTTLSKSTVFVTEGNKEAAFAALDAIEEEKFVFDVLVEDEVDTGKRPHRW